MRVAIIADIHSNYPALQAVVTDIATQGVDEIIVAGDAVNGAPYPREVQDLIYARGWRMVKGNHEQYMLDCADGNSTKYPADTWKNFYWTLARLNETDLHFMATLPEQLVLDDLMILHAAPQQLNWGVLPSTDDETLARLFNVVHQRYIITAHTHIPLVCQWQDKTIINPGAVGMSFDGNPAASYVILTRINGQMMIQHRRVNYDVAQIETLARASGYLDVDIFARNTIRQIVTGRPSTRALLKAIQHIQDITGVDFPTAACRVDLADVHPDTDYVLARRKKRG